MGLINKTTVSLSIFDEVIERKNSNSMKWDGGKYLLSADERACDGWPIRIFVCLKL